MEVDDVDIYEDLGNFDDDNNKNVSWFYFFVVYFCQAKCF